MITAIKKIHSDLDARYPKQSRVLRYLISGGTSTFVDLVLLYVLTDFVKIKYLISAVIAFIIAFFVSFYLQKYWTFQDNNKDGVHKQMGVYLFVALTNLGINTLFMYIFVDHFHVHYMVAQFFIAGLIAIMSFFVYKKFIFKKAASAVI